MMNAVDDERSGMAPTSDSPTGLSEAERPQPEPESDEEETARTADDPRTTIAGRYAVDLQTEPVNAGIAVTYQGRDLRTRDPVLVKTLRLEYRGDPDMRARFRREARLLQFLTHPNVIRALTFTEERGAPWLVLERVPGRTLREEIATRAPYSPEEVVPILQGMAAALDHLHARGLVHLDVRPENVVVTPGREVKFIDFGIAQTAGGMQEHADGGADDPTYLAPEQLSGKPVTVATDVYALGCVVYELLTGKPPFPVATSPSARNAVVRARLEQAPVPPTAALGGTALPSWVDSVVLGALERDPRQRYSSAGSFAAVLHSGVEGDIDVETGRPRLPVQPVEPRRFPINEPAIAIKGSRRLAARRAEPTTEVESARSDVVDAAFAPVAVEKPIAYRTTRGGRISSLDLQTLSRRLWQAVILAAVLNLILIAALLVTRGEIPGVWSPGGAIGPGVSVRIAGTGLVARAGPSTDSDIVAELPDGGTVRISGSPVAGEGGLWWPVEVDTESGTISGYVPETWVQAP